MNDDGRQSGMPDGWEWRELADLGTWVGGGTPSKQRSEFWDGGTIPWVSPKDMKRWRLDGTQDAITATAVDRSAAKLFSANSVALVVRSGILEHTLPVALVPFQATANQDMRVITPGEGVHAEWLMYALQADADRVRRACRKDGTTVASIDVPKLAAWSLPVPTLDEQRRIVRRIEGVSSVTAAAEAHLAAAEKMCGQLWRSMLHRLVTLPHERMTIGDVADVFVGATPPRGDSALWGGQIPWVSSGEVRFRRIAETQESLSEKGLGNRETRLHPPGTVLLAMIGEGKTRGQAALLDVWASHNQNSAAIRPDRKRLLPEFLYYWLMRQYETTRRAGTGSQQGALNSKLVRAIRISLPPLDRQRTLAVSLAKQEERISGLRQEILRQLQVSANLRRASLQHAICGSMSRSETPA